MSIDVGNEFVDCIKVVVVIICCVGVDVVIGGFGGEVDFF